MIRMHSIRLAGDKTRLRPFTEDDIRLACEWHQDPIVLHFSDTDEVSEHSLDDVRGIYEAMSEQGFLFVIATADGTPVGEVCLQWMNIERAGVKPGEKVMRFPIVICDPRYWGTAYPKRREQVTH